MKPFTFIDLFAGIGGFHLAFATCGGECVFASEWDEEAQKTYQLNFGHLPSGDITQIPSSEIPDHDILTAGFPCQPFSIIGQGLGFADTRGTVFFEIERILADKRPKAFLLENVKQLVSHDHGRTLQIILQKLKDIGYFVHWAVLNALDFGLPQKRERIFIVGFLENYHFSFPKKAHFFTPKKLADILENEEEIDPKYFASPDIRQKRLEAVQNKKLVYPAVWHENKGGNIGVHPFSCALRAGASFSYLLVNGERRLTPREQLRLQGFPETFQILGTETQIRRQIGNAVPVPVVQEIAFKMLQQLSP